MAEPDRPSWVVNYNIITSKSPWIGTGYEFFNDRESAEQRFRSIPAKSPRYDYFGPVCGSMRPYYHKHDKDYVTK